MKIVSVKSYLTSTVKTPYFLFVSDEQYLSIIDELKIYELDFVPMSSFCSSHDKIPDIDGLISYIEAADVNANRKKFVVIGLGEFLALQGISEARHTLWKLKDLNVGGAKVVLLLRGLAPLISELNSDPRFDNRRHSIIDSARCDLSFTLVAPFVGLSATTEFKTILTELESGQSGSIVVSTAVNLSKSMFTIRQINSAYEGIRFLTRDFVLACSCGTDAQWVALLSDMIQLGGSLDAVWDKYGLRENWESDFYARIAGREYHNWIHYIYLKIEADNLPNRYLQLVLDKTSRFEDFIGNIINAIIEIPHSDKCFDLYYKERKMLVEKFPEPDIAVFVVNNRQRVTESLFKLTDNTHVERAEIVAWLSANGMVPQLENIYPALYAYLKKYVFKCSENADLYTDYFEAYKRQKLFNCLDPKFLKMVGELALLRPFNRLPSREDIIENIEKEGTYLYWLDALGVEYLSLIEALAQKKGLSVRIHIARAELPTITTKNRNFFDIWEGEKNGINGDKELDDVKHKEKSGYDFTKNKLPVHLAREVEIVVAVIERAATELSFRHCKRFLIASDHGASRLAVLRRKEEKYPTDTSSKYSGRCCRSFEHYDLPFATEENGYIVLADYGRFKGSRKANVEVHGGASLEEVVVPIIELSLKDDTVSVKLVDETVVVDFRTGAEITLFFNAPVRAVSVVINGKSYQVLQADDNHYTVKIPDIKRAGDYLADVYTGDDLIGKILIKAQGKSGKINDDFDDLF